MRTRRTIRRSPAPAAAAAAGGSIVDFTSPSKSGISDTELLQLQIDTETGADPVNGAPDIQKPNDNEQETTNNKFAYGDTSSSEDEEGKPKADPLVVPFKDFKFDPQANQEAKSWPKNKQNEETTFAEAIKPLIPLEQLKPKLINFRNAMYGVSITIDKSYNSFQWIADQPDYIHKCVDVKPVFQIPFGAENYPTTFNKLYTHVNSQLEAMAHTFRRNATDLIHKGHGIMCLQYKLDRIHLMFTHLIQEIGQYHSAYFRARNPDKGTRDPTTRIPSDIEIAITGVYTLLEALDLEVLEYLDINRSKLIEIYTERFKPTPATALKQHSHDIHASAYVTNTMLGYIKATTVSHYKAKITKEQETLARASVAAKIERNQASAAMEATDKAITAATLPTSSKTLTDAIHKVIDNRQWKSILKRSSPQVATPNGDRTNTAKRRKPNHPNAQAPPKQPRAANAKGKSSNKKQNRAPSSSSDPTKRQKSKKQRPRK